MVSGCEATAPDCGRYGDDLSFFVGASLRRYEPASPASRLESASGRVLRRLDSGRKPVCVSVIAQREDRDMGLVRETRHAVIRRLAAINPRANYLRPDELNFSRVQSGWENAVCHRSRASRRIAALGSALDAVRPLSGRDLGRDG